MGHLSSTVVGIGLGSATTCPVGPYAGVPQYSGRYTGVPVYCAGGVQPIISVPHAGACGITAYRHLELSLRLPLLLDPAVMIVMSTASVSVVVLVVIAIATVRWVYGIYASPLRSIPGPFLAALTPYYQTLLGYLDRRTSTVYEWHRKYGPIVRVGPREISILSPESIKAVYSDPSFLKHTPLYGQFRHFDTDSAFTSETKEQHSWRRKGYSSVYKIASDGCRGRRANMGV